MVLYNKKIINDSHKTAFVAKFDLNLRIIWLNKAFENHQPPDVICKIQCSSEGDIYVLGSYTIDNYLPETKYPSIFLGKITSEGTWTQKVRIVAEGGFSSLNLSLDTEGIPYITGKAESSTVTAYHENDTSIEFSIDKGFMAKVLTPVREIFPVVVIEDTVDKKSKVFHNPGLIDVFTNLRPGKNYYYDFTKGLTLTKTKLFIGKAVTETQMLFRPYPSFLSLD
jgi:hypothetical protein